MKWVYALQVIKKDNKIGRFLGAYSKVSTALEVGAAWASYSKAPDEDAVSINALKVDSDDAKREIVADSRRSRRGAGEDSGSARLNDADAGKRGRNRRSKKAPRRGAPRTK